MTAADRPSVCCGVCPPIAGGGWDCTCEGLPGCPVNGPGLAAGRAEAVEVIKAHLTEFLVDYDAEEFAWNILNDLCEVGWAAGRAETTTATTEDVVDAARRVLAEMPGGPLRPIEAAEALDAHGLLASSSPAHTRPTEPETRTTTEWGVRGYRNSDRTVFFSGEDSARYEARTHGGAVIRQQVTTWPEGE